MKPTDDEIERLEADGNQARLESLLRLVPEAVAETIVNDALSGVNRTPRELMYELGAAALEAEAEDMRHE